MKDNQQPQTIYLKDYQAPDFFIETTYLNVKLAEVSSLVSSTLQISRRNDSDATVLVLDGEDLELVELYIDGQTLDPSRYQVTLTELIINDVPENFSLMIITRLYPQNNTRLDGLYKSSGNFCTQCEAQSFRRITYYLDRPDVMSRFTVKITADKTSYPVLLANGNLIESGDLQDGQHFAVWEDPFVKPCYLFALVAGDLAKIEDSFTTQSGRNVSLEIYSEPHNIADCDYAMISLKKSMQWDEEVYGLEYDLDRYMIVAVEDFNMGAMENKGLNIFNTKYVLASKSTATDQDFQGVEAVIGHEYFHNWTGNRITCRDWFQLSLKEGLTVFRDQTFSGDMGSHSAKRIADVRLLRSRQFPEDAGPMAHPIRPSRYIEINNFYTLTIYEKGAEVIRMIHTLLGHEGFHKGIKLYVERHDGQAVTCDDFVSAMEDANQYDLTQFKHWYDQAGTPLIRAEGHYDADKKTYQLTLSQETPATPEQNTKPLFHIPVSLGLLNPDGTEAALTLDHETQTGPCQRVLSLIDQQQTFCFKNIHAKPVPSLFRGFSAPVNIEHNISNDQLCFLARHDTDSFNRWESAQILGSRTLLSLADQVEKQQALNQPIEYLGVIQSLLADQKTDPALLAEALIIPDVEVAAISEPVIKLDQLQIAREYIRHQIHHHLGAQIRERFLTLNKSEPYQVEAKAIGRRRLKAVLLDLLCATEQEQDVQLAYQLYQSADNMTDTISALSILSGSSSDFREPCLNDFHQKWQSNSLVIDKWFALQAKTNLNTTIDDVRKLLKHPDFNHNPNRVRSLIGVFAMANPLQFHRHDGAGYQLLSEFVIQYDAVNPQVNARLVSAFAQWRRYDNNRQALMHTELERILSTTDLSKDVYEIASKTLGA